MKTIRDYIRKLNYDKRESLRVIKSNFWRINWIKTIWMNFCAFPIKHAIKIPIIVSYNSKIKNIGKITIPDDSYPGMISIGVIKISAIETNKIPTIFNNRGTFNIGGRLKIHPGAVVAVVKNAVLTVGNHVGFGANTKVVSRSSIKIGNDVRCSWNCQILDSDFHFLYNIEKDKYYPRTKEIIIGNNVFIGNGCSIGKGTVIPDGCVISCISKVSRDFTKEGENLLLMGNPATIIKKGVNISNGWYPEEENRIAKIIKQQ